MVPVRFQKLSMAMSGKWTSGGLPYNKAKWPWTNVASHYDDCGSYMTVIKDTTGEYYIEANTSSGEVRWGQLTKKEFESVESMDIEEARRHFK